MEPPVPVAEDPPPPVRISLLHLFAWMTASALVLGIDSRLVHYFYQTAEQTRVLQVLEVFRAAITGLALTSLLWLVQYGFSNPARFPRLPGHWIFLSLGISAASSLVATCLIPTDKEGAVIGSWIAVQWCATSISRISVLLVACTYQKQGIWRGFFASWALWEMLTTGYLIQFLPVSVSAVTTLMAVSKAGELLLAVAAIAFSFWNRSRQASDQLDRLGVCLLIFKAAHSMAVLAWVQWVKGTGP